jgi:hypothetical protein
MAEYRKSGKQPMQQGPAKWFVLQELQKMIQLTIHDGGALVAQAFVRFSAPRHEDGRLSHQSARENVE